MLNRKWKHPNAQKHGSFAKTAILPGENRREFEQLHSALIEEWMPVGPTEEEAVLSIAKGMWRKRRVQRYLEAEGIKAIFDPKHQAYDEITCLALFAAMMNSNPGRFEENSALLPVYLVKYFRQKFPRNNFKSDSEWVEAIIHEIASVLVPQYASLREHMPDEFLAIQSSATLSQDLFKQEVALDERLDAMIDRAIKRLIQTKAMKQMLGHSLPNGGDDQPKGLQSNKSNDNNKVRPVS
jgi:predicted metallopeptidase